MTDPRTDAAAAALSPLWIDDGYIASTPHYNYEKRRETAIRTAASQVITAADAALDWEAFTAKLELRGFDQREQGLILADIQGLLGLAGDKDATTNNTMSHNIRVLSDWIDDGNASRDPEAHTWQRVAKIAEETGEVVAAMIGVTGGNPRKGVTACWDDVADELLDVALTALAAYAHLEPGCDVMAVFGRFVSHRCRRVGLNGGET